MAQMAREAILDLIKSVKRYPSSCGELLQLAGDDASVSLFLKTLPKDTIFESAEDIFERFMQAQALHDQREEMPVEIVYDEDMGAP